MYMGHPGHLNFSIIIIIGIVHAPKDHTEGQSCSKVAAKLLQYSGMI